VRDPDVYVQARQSARGRFGLIFRNSDKCVSPLAKSVFKGSQGMPSSSSIQSGRKVRVWGVP
jgi:hypothetical protein